MNDDDLWRVFISHSTADNREGVASQLVDVLMEELPKHRIGRWVDRDGLFVGDEWRPKIAEEIHGSHVGIVLLDDKALESQWVRDEAFLMQNEPVDRNYQVIIVLIGLSRDDVKARPFTDLVTNKHYVALDKVGFDGVLPEVLRTLYCPELGLLQAGEMSLVRKVAELLPTDPDTVRALTEPFRRPQDSPPLLAREFLAYLMLKARCDLLVHKMFHKGRRFFARQHRSDLEFLLSLLEPSWIPLDLVASMVPPDGKEDRLGVVGTLPGTAGRSISLDTGEAVVRRATHWDEDTCAVLPFGRVPEGTELDGLEVQLEDVDYWATNPDPTKYVVLQAGTSRTNRLEGVRRVHERWPDVVVVLVIGEPDPQDDLATSCYHRTALSCDREAEARKEIDKISGLLEVERKPRAS
ncbi:toll/interleukin-1 receptor domain-containing protein [Lentzea nigeriaca]|uniref:toll/interleukin-1 receptor domain-containing protein n=1 Tax=Lentzea nigeriaca TaxID=1128665 RepID=UPI00195E6782|nr:toll/interleukin-1 receptor domain-containing protein [Lentzea nigeriaca]MBM7864338.1 hypothetical protein [Lentzea nigeriaca]